MRVHNSVSESEVSSPLGGGEKFFRTSMISNKSDANPHPLTLRKAYREPLAKGAAKYPPT